MIIDAGWSWMWATLPRIDTKHSHTRLHSHTFTHTHTHTHSITHTHYDAFLADLNFCLQFDRIEWIMTEIAKRKSNPWIGRIIHTRFSVIFDHILEHVRYEICEESVWTRARLDIGNTNICRFFPFIFFFCLIYYYQKVIIRRNFALTG